MLPPVIALHGLPRAGKDTLAGEIVRHYAETADECTLRLAFADSLYDSVAGVFGVPADSLRSHEWKTQAQECLALWHAQNPDYRQFLASRGLGVFDPQTSRYHLQVYGTDYTHEREGVDYWARQLVLRLDRDLVENGPRPVVVTDLRRYGNSFHELDALRCWAAQRTRRLVVVQVERPGLAYPTASHSSDAVFPASCIDVRVCNAEGEPPVQMLNQLTDYLRDPSYRMPQQ